GDTGVLDQLSVAEPVLGADEGELIGAVECHLEDRRRDRQIRPPESMAIGAVRGEAPLERRSTAWVPGHRGGHVPQYSVVGLSSPPDHSPRAGTRTGTEVRILMCIRIL